MTTNNDAARDKKSLGWFDLDRMKKALTGPFHKVPEDSSREQTKDYILEVANKTK